MPAASQRGPCVCSAHMEETEGQRQRAACMHSQLDPQCRLLGIQPQGAVAGKE